jgi:uncharacterized membrane protein YqjE
METRVAADNQEPSIAELIKSIVAESKDFVRAEVDLTKADLKRTLKLAAFALVFFTAGGVLLAFALSLLAAAIVLAAHGTPVAAMLAAAAVDIAVGGGAIGWLIVKLRSPSDGDDDAKTKAVAPVNTQQRSEIS